MIAGRSLSYLRVVLSVFLLVCGQCGVGATAQRMAGTVQLYGKVVVAQGGTIAVMTDSDSRNFPGKLFKIVVKANTRVLEVGSLQMGARNNYNKTISASDLKVGDHVMLLGSLDSPTATDYVAASVTRIADSSDKVAGAPVASFASSSGAFRVDDITGTWQGTLKMSQDHRVVVTISDDNGRLRATLTSIEQGTPHSVEASAVTLQGSTLRFSQPPPTAGSYEGKVSADGSSIVGTWIGRYPLVLQRATHQTAPPVTGETPVPSSMATVGSTAQTSAAATGQSGSSREQSLRGAVQAKSANTISLGRRDPRTTPVTVAAGAKILQLPTGCTAVDCAIPIQLADISIGDGIAVYGTQASPGAPFTATQVILRVKFGSKVSGVIKAVSANSVRVDTDEGESVLVDAGAAKIKIHQLGAADRPGQLADLIVDNPVEITGTAGSSPGTVAAQTIWMNFLYDPTRYAREHSPLPPPKDDGRGITDPNKAAARFWSKLLNSCGDTYYYAWSHLGAGSDDHDPLDPSVVIQIDGFGRQIHRQVPITEYEDVHFRVIPNGLTTGNGSYFTLEPKYVTDLTGLLGVTPQWFGLFEMRSGKWRRGSGTLDEVAGRGTPLWEPNYRQAEPDGLRSDLQNAMLGTHLSKDEMSNPDKHPIATALAMLDAGEHVLNQLSPWGGSGTILVQAWLVDGKWYVSRNFPQTPQIGVKNGSSVSLNPLFSGPSSFVSLNLSLESVTTDIIHECPNRTLWHRDGHYGPQ